MKASRIARSVDLSAPPLGEQRRNRIETAINGLAIPQDARIVEGVTLASGASANVAHQLGRGAAGYIASNARTSAPLLYRTVQSDELEAAYLRVTHTGASSTTFDLVVW